MKLVQGNQIPKDLNRVAGVKKSSLNMDTTFFLVKRTILTLERKLGKKCLDVFGFYMEKNVQESADLLILDLSS